MTALRMRVSILVAPLGLAAVLLSRGAAVSDAPPAVSFVVDAADDVSDAAPGDGACATAAATCTLRAAIEEAVAGGGASTIELPAGQYVLGTALDVAGGTVTVRGAGRATTIVDGASGTRVLEVRGGAGLVLQGLTITNGAAAQEGGAIGAYDATLDLDAVTVSTSAADGYGGGLFAAGSIVTITASTFDHDTGLEGGAVAVMGGDLTITGSAFTGCLAPDAGGAIAAFAPRSLSITDSTFTGNTAEHSGGAIWVAGAAGTGRYGITGSTFAGNTSFGGFGGALATDGLVAPGTNGDLTITNSTFDDNQADRAGGAIATVAPLTSTGNTFRSNHAPESPDVSTPVPFDLCAVPNGCDDQDACTVDSCVAIACRHAPKAGFDAMGCRLDGVDAALAGAAPIDLKARWKTKLQKLAHGVRAKLQLAVGADRAGNAKKRRKALKRTIAAAKTMQKAITKGVQNHKMAGPLGEVLGALLGGGIDALSGLLSPT
ncbi:MAG: hypothetical protein U0807_13815 [Candidatus Binatia bacterium]